MKRTPVVRFHLPAETLAKLDEEAFKANRTRADLIRDAVHAALGIKNPEPVRRGRPRSEAR